MSEILGANGKPYVANHVAGKSQPVKGEAFGAWAAGDRQYLELPGGGMVQFDLSRLNIADFRTMTSHYQVNSSLSVLMFMLHQLDWHIECEDQKIADHVEDNLRDIWTRLVRAMSQAFWAGYAPNVLQWENDSNKGSLQLTKIKDLAPEEASVNWKVVDGAVAPGAASQIKPKIKVFDGIRKVGLSSPIPVTNSFWYPLLMENGNYAGRKLLKSAFQPWFFSTLMHLFSNRYFERFGEPVPVGRAPLDEMVPVGGGKEVTATDYMGQLLQRLRSRSAVVLPSDRAMGSDSGSLQSNYEYDIEYLESQMRGADFERYMTRLDEEISLALFTPLLLMRTADVGSYNLGVSHMQMYLWQLNAISSDWAEYINKYIIAPMARYNFGPKAKLPKIIFRKMGKSKAETNQAIVAELLKQGKVKPDVTMLGQEIGIELEEIETLIEPAEEPEFPERTEEPADDDADAPEEGSDNERSRISVTHGAANTPVIDRVIARVRPQAARAHARGQLGAGWVPDIGFSSHYAQARVDGLLEWHNEAVELGAFADDSEYMEHFESAARAILEGA